MHSAKTERNQKDCSEQDGKGGTEKVQIITSEHIIPWGIGKI